MTLSFFLSTNHSSNSAPETAGSLAYSNNNNGHSGNSIEVAGSLAFLSSPNGGMDSFGGRDMFASPNCANMDASLFANASSPETAGGLACAIGSDFSGADSGASAGAGASAGGGDCGGGGGGGFSSVC